MSRWPFAALPSVKRERDTDAESEVGDGPPKRQAVETNAVVPVKPVFPWTTGEALGDVERLKLKEDALKIAEHGATAVRTTLESTLHQLQQGSTARNPVIVGQALIERWLNEHAALRKQHQNLEILIGVEGPTGAGKSSFLDSLLVIPELFPSGHQGAATATIAKVSWNWDDALEHLFRAKITFQSISDIEKMLESVLKDIKALFDREAPDNNVDPDEEAEAKDTIDYRIKYEMAKIKAVWGLDRADLEGKVKRKGKVDSYMPLVQRILEKNPRAHHFLRQGMIEFKNETLEDLRAQVKPFMTSKPSKFGSDRMFAVWPLVKDVHMFVKSDILESGMTLVDLPGCSDSTASRSEIARNYSHLLDVRLVVSPIIRATDENQGQVLMQSGFDEAQMKIRGKYDGHGFGVVLSKTDQLSVDKYITDFLTEHDDTEVRDNKKQLKKLKNEMTRIQKGIKGATSSIKKAKSEEKKAIEAYKKAAKNQNNPARDDPETSRKNIEKLQERVNKASKDVKEKARTREKARARAQKLSQDIFDVDNWLHQRAIEERNRVVQAQIQEDYDARQRELNRTDHGHHVLPMFPVSTEAFWKLADEPTPVKGYPTMEATGVPAAQRWLLKATSSKREKHLDNMLSKYHNLMDMMRIYSNENDQDADFCVTHAEVQNALGHVHQNIAASLSMLISAETVKIDALNPLANRKMAERRFRTESSRIATSWSRSDPSDENSGFMPWSTYGAIMKRGGETYTSKGQRPMTYSWIEDMSSPVLKAICKECYEEMNRKLQHIGNSIAAAFRKGWAPYSKNIEQVIGQKFPGLELIFSDFITMMSSIERLGIADIKTRVDKLISEASKVTMDAKDFLKGEFDPIFEAGLLITGRRSYEKRRAHNVSSIEYSSDAMCSQMMDCLALKLEEKKREGKAELGRIAGEVIARLKDRLNDLVDSLVDNSPADSGLKEKKLELQKQIRANLHVWEQYWQKQGVTDEDTRQETTNGQGNGDEDVDTDDNEDDEEANYHELVELLGDDDEME
ncbi:GTPase SLIP-GC [Fusarium agapanthi]|uniref:GTPase SLIP-GC n=1 Tax=Fusarium agapanthi TaxID=1803897 RepID=A0A9P5BAU0_9HYPO|nr:GTPase SLIP-GC [Fusarium agapanthi]